MLQSTLPGVLVCFMLFEQNTRDWVMYCQCSGGKQVRCQGAASGEGCLAASSPGWRPAHDCEIRVCEMCLLLHWKAHESPSGPFTSKGLSNGNCLPKASPPNVIDLRIWRLTFSHVIRGEILKSEQWVTNMNLRWTF